VEIKSSEIKRWYRPANLRLPLARAIAEGKEREIRTVGKSPTTSSVVGFKRRGSGRAPTNLMKNINILLPQHM
jgi:hypothetical protein